MDKERLEAMGAEALVEELSDRLDQMGEEGFDPDVVDAYLEVLGREAPVASGFDVHAAEEDFRARHADLFAAPALQVMEGRRAGRRVRRVAGRVAAVAAVVAVSSALAAQGMGIDLFGAIARWSKGQFRFDTTGTQEEGYAPTIWEDDTFYSDGQAALDAYGVEEKMMPTWNPVLPGSEVPGLEVSVTEEDGVVLFVEDHRLTDGRGYTYEVRQHQSAEATQADLVGVDASDTEVYEFDGRTYYIAPADTGEYTITWTVGKYSGKVYGTMDLEMAKHFARSVTQWDDIPYEPPDMSVPPEFDTIQKAMAAVGIDAQYAPAWLPEGYVPVQSSTYESDYGGWTSASLYYTDIQGKRDLVLGLDWYEDPSAAGGRVYEKDDTPVVEYERGGITFYIMNNLTRKTVAWLDGNISGSFSGELTVEECQDIIDSIPAYAE
ncbi:DUF4367 domain-containing protein [Intestinimonas butyriciproducens]|uniref:Uncharacterized protein DUF4367 n=1 Tax=Intestinimonas butyriciproducens TaxID=1297617 RepID=A0A2U1CD74_9FIRM|nr:DUF4367 domain-containing protein [Intestinimonas butyriciproducens]MBU5229800.1 DUF4367 domain-containing protein [Intestinimonas butyriciproducens]MCB7048939.1 DUF4367 domain-containing protein [Intestinimonas butyriciproducens]MCR1905824.1 DUF4367 domain-containing protein [Intestinimonas butyriciproducens]PVY58883.1 uncharacterized protein DUF4367 [Intestinimonas butyriciproducens]QBB66531.1 hypothetical protein SRB521_02272 [Intestinimonas butyriciproducens]